MKIKDLKFAFLIILLSLMLVGGCAKKEKTMPKYSTGKKVLMIIAFKDFQDQEYGDTRDVLETSKTVITVASSSLGTARGKFGRAVKIDKIINEVNVENYDGIVFIGGPGAIAYVRHPGAHRLAQEAVKKNKVLAAICIAPEILARAGVLKNKKATVWSSITYRSPIKILEAGGAKYIDQDVVIDGKIITANGARAAKKFGQAIVNLLSK